MCQRTGTTGLRDSAEDSRVGSSSTSLPGGEEEEGHRSCGFRVGSGSEPAHCPAQDEQRPQSRWEGRGLQHARWRCPR